LRPPTMTRLAGNHAFFIRHCVESAAALMNVEVFSIRD
jgi:hypothetical protein